MEGIHSEQSASESFDEEVFGKMLDYVENLKSSRKEGTSAMRNTVFVGHVFRFLSEHKDIFEQSLYQKEKRVIALNSLDYLAFEADNDDNLGKLISSIREKIQPAIINSLEINPASRQDILPILSFHSTSISLGNDAEKLKGVESINHYIPEIEKELYEKSLDYNHYIEKVLKFGNEDAVKKMEDMVVRVADRYKSEGSLENYFSILSKFEKTASKVNEFIEHKLSRAHIPAETILSHWKESAKRQDIYWAYAENLQRISEIEAVKPGVAKILHEGFELNGKKVGGISDFARYPKEILLDMLDNYENKSTPYGLIMYPRNDHNGAFYQDAEHFRKLYQDLGGEFLLRIVECETKKDVVLTLVAMNEHYNPADESGQKISMLMMGGHGQEDHIRFGGEDKNHAIFTKDLMGKRGERAKKTKQFFADGLQIILASCSTGAEVEAGIARQLSTAFGAEVIAPKVPESISRMSATKNSDGKFIFDIDFSKSDSKNTYQQGNLENKE
ncbi:MAG: hypothetical protein EXS52_01850 [Candidatus Staskawiczbacteria bacterium]|nr:hypothetical protein [Candidatus Staskawiczbacteria bacterium]